MNPTPMSIDRELLAKYDRPGPRYTSYPTVPVWRDDFGHEDYARKLDEAGAAGDDLPLSLYVHLPFCKEMCTYCGCNVVISQDKKKHTDYVENVRAELRMAASHLRGRRKLLQLHYGGGTPTSLDEELLLRLWDTIATEFPLLKGAEAAIEVDPVVTRKEQLALLRGMGFNRISMGVQDFTPEVQRAVNRVQTVEETEALTKYARLLGFRGINFDLIYGLPHQNEETFGRSLDEVVRIGPDRVAIFSYAHLPEVRTHQKKIDAATLPQGEAKLALFLLARRKLLEAGYVTIGMDHFAKADDELAIAQQERRLSRNFQGYTVRPAQDIIAVGATAISDLRGAYAQNTRPLGAYASAIAAGKFPVVKGTLLTADDLLRRDAITQILCNFWLDLPALGSRHGVDAKQALARSLESLGELEADGLVRVGTNEVEVLPAGRPFVRNVAMCFDAYLETEAPSGKKIFFSRTV